MKVTCFYLRQTPSYGPESIGGSEGEPRGALPPWTLVLPPFGLLKQWSQP